MKSCRLIAHCIAGVDSRDLACMTMGHSLEVQELLRLKSPTCLSGTRASLPAVWPNWYLD